MKKEKNLVGKVLDTALAGLTVTVLGLGSKYIDQHVQKAPQAEPLHSEAVFQAEAEGIPLTTYLSQQSESLTPPADKKPSVPTVPRATVVLDPGHGMSNATKGLYDPGAVHGTLRESDLVLDQALKVGELLKENNINVLYTRDDHTDITPLKTRAQYANTNKADLFVSLHVNAFTNDKAQGVRVYHHPGSTKGHALGRELQDGIEDSLEASVLGFSQSYEGLRSGNFNVLRNTTMPAALVESGFITNARDRKYLTEHEDSIAEGIANGILDYLNANPSK